MTLRPIATNFGTNELKARFDAKRLSAALGQPVLLWKEGGIWYALNAAKAVGKELNFEHELIQSK